MKKFYCLFALVTLLFAACSDNASPVSGSTSVPNMGNDLIPQSPVLCSVLGVTDFQEAVEKGCVWSSPKMWSRTSGYRVRTGYDNGTNTSGIWTWHVEQGDDGNVRFEWPGVATAEYDSMALADVIDKCGGSLCGKVVYEPNESEIDSAIKYIENDGYAYAEFYLAGKDSLGNFEEIDARAMKGICVEYSGSVAVELIPNDSIANLNKFYTYGVWFPYVWNPDDPQSKIKKVCLPWSQFGVNTSTYVPLYQKKPEILFVPIEDVVAHLKGLRFTFPYDEVNTEFNVISVDWYHWDNRSMADFHPYNETCEPIKVVASFCDCEFSEDRAVHYATVLASQRFENKKKKVENDIAPLSDSSKECLKNVLDSLENLREIRSVITEPVPCDNPLPSFFLCADGNESVTIEFAEKYAEYSDNIERPLEEKMIVDTDSLFAHCMSLNE